MMQSLGHCAADSSFDVRERLNISRSIIFAVSPALWSKAEPVHFDKSKDEQARKYMFTG
jgi:hypothetical protein